MGKFIYTADQDSFQMALNELNQLPGGFRLLKPISPGVQLLSSELEFAEIAAQVAKETIFIRHICPVNLILMLHESMPVGDFATEAVAYIKDHLPQEETFSIQTRVYRSLKDYKKNDVNERIAAKLTEKGFQLDVKNPENIVSILLEDDKGYLGISKAALNLSNWAGGACRYKKDGTVISRAEFKLLEAIEVFHLDLSVYGRALDLGAAPGGWSKVLAENVRHVHSVDPAPLDHRLSKYKNITHFSSLAQDFYQESDQSYDIIVNDMKMDAFESVEVMRLFLNRLTLDGIGVMTLKLKSTHTQSQLNKVMSKLKETCQVTKARQLYHNRSEVTVVLRGIT